MKYLLDTNICIYAINKRDKSILTRMKWVGLEHIVISSITIAELEYGIAGSSKPIEAKQALLQFLLPFSIIDFTSDCGSYYGRVRLDLKRKGNPIGVMDLLIASIALSNNLIVVTNNTNEFNRVQGLEIENWYE